MKNTYFRDFLNALDNLVEDQKQRTTLKESPGDTYYVSKMKEKFIAMEAEENTENTMTDAPEEKMSDEAVSSSINMVKTALGSNVDAKTAFEKLLKNFGCESDVCSETEESDMNNKSKSDNEEDSTPKFNFESFLR